MEKETLLFSEFVDDIQIQFKFWLTEAIRWSKIVFKWPISYFNNWQSFKAKHLKFPPSISGTGDTVLLWSTSGIWQFLRYHGSLYAEIILITRYYWHGNFTEGYSYTPRFINFWFIKQMLEKNRQIFGDTKLIISENISSSSIMI